MITINNWSQSFETADTRKRQRLGWFLAPSGCDSRGYRLLMREGTKGTIALGVFQALCQVMATLKKEIRIEGNLVNSDGTGMELADIREITRMEVADLEAGMELLEKVGWITLKNQGSASDVPPICHQSASDVPRNSGFVKGEGQGQEQEQGKGEEAASPSKPSPKKSRGTMAEFKAYAIERGLTEQDGESMFEGLEASGWLRGKTPIKCWKAHMRSWQANGYHPSQKKAQNPFEDPNQYNGTGFDNFPKRTKGQPQPAKNEHSPF